MATYPKIGGSYAGNADAKYDLFHRDTEYDGLEIASYANVAVYQKAITHSIDEHNEIYTFFVIKNTSETNGSFLALSEISITDMTSGIKVWSTDGTVDANAPIELDYTAYGNATKPFVGIQDESDGTVNNGLDFLLHDASGADAYSSSDYFAKFALIDDGGKGVVKLIDDADSSHSSARIKNYPIYLASDLVADSESGGGIPSESYAVIVMRADASSVTEFNTRSYKLTIKHNGLNSSNQAQDIQIPITLSMENKMNVQMKINGAVIASNDSSGTLSGNLYTVMNYNPDSTSTGTDVSGALERVGSFDTVSEKDAYIAGNEEALTSYNNKRTAFTSDQISWNDTSVVSSAQVIDYIVTGETGLFEAAALAGFAIGDRVELTASENTHVIPLKQTSVSPLVSSGSFVDGQDNPDSLSNFDVSNVGVSTIQAIAVGDQDTKDTTVSFGAVSYPCMTLPSHTLGLRRSARPSGVNHANWIVDDTVSSPIVHGTDTYSVPKDSLGLGTLMEMSSSSLFPIALWGLLSTPASSFSFNVRLNSYSTAYDPYYNGISEFNGSSSTATGAGFAFYNCEVAVLKYADTNNTNDIATMSIGDASQEATDLVATPISGLGDNFRDYSVLLKTSSTWIKSSQSLREYDFFNYTDTIDGLGVRTFASNISLPTGIINYGSGKVPNHTQGANFAQFSTAYYPAAPTLCADFQEGVTNPVGASIMSPSYVNKWQKLGTDSSTRTVASDGIYDWNKDSEDSSEVGLYSMSSTNKVDWTNSTNIVELKTWEVAAASGHSAGGGVLTVSAPNNLQRGMRLLETASGTPSIPADCIITEINTGTGAVTLSRAIPDAISDGDIIFVDDWVQTGMVVESPTQLVNAEEVYISAMTYNGGTSDGNAYDLSTLEAARDGGAGTINVTLKNKNNDTAANPATTLAYDDGSAVGFTKIKKPYHVFASIPMGMDFQYEILNQELNRCVNGDTVIIQNGSEHTNFGSANNASNTEYTVSGSPSSVPDGNIVSSVINRQPKEWGALDPDGNQIYSKRNLLWSSAAYSESLYSQYVNASGVNALLSYDLALVAGDLTGTTYTKEFSVKLSNTGAEDIYLHSASFVDIDYTHYNKDSFISEPSGASGVSWSLGSLASAPSSASTIFPVGDSAYDEATPSGHTTTVPANGDQRLTRFWKEDGDGGYLFDPNDPTWFTDANSFRCKFNCESGGGASGTYYKALKIKYYRDSARVKYYKNEADVLIERPFKDKEIYETLIPVSITLDVVSLINVSDADNLNIGIDEVVTINGLVG